MQDRVVDKINHPSGSVATKICALVVQFSRNVRRAASRAPSKFACLAEKVVKNVLVAGRVCGRSAHNALSRRQPRVMIPEPGTWNRSRYRSPHMSDESATARSACAPATRKHTPHFAVHPYNASTCNARIIPSVRALLIHSTPDRPGRHANCAVGHSKERRRRDEMCSPFRG